MSKMLEVCSRDAHLTFFIILFCSGYKLLVNVYLEPTIEGYNSMLVENDGNSMWMMTKKPDEDEENHIDEPFRAVEVEGPRYFDVVHPQYNMILILKSLVLNFSTARSAAQSTRAKSLLRGISKVFIQIGREEYKVCIRTNYFQLFYPIQAPCQQRKLCQKQ